MAVSLTLDFEQFPDLAPHLCVRVQIIDKSKFVALSMVDDIKN